MNGDNWINGATIAAGIATVIGVVFTIITIVIPYFIKSLRKMKAQVLIDKAMHDVILGRAAIPENTITGEHELAALPSIAERMNYVTEMAEDLQASQQIQIQKIDSIAHEMAINSESRLTKLEDLTEELRAQLKALYTALHTTVVRREDND